MSGGLYSMEEKDFDKNLNLKAIKPYGDTMNDGKVQPAGDEAVEAAKQLIKAMGLNNPQVVFYKELTPGFTFFNCYGSATQTVDFTAIHVPKVESNVRVQCHGYARNRRVYPGEYRTQARHRRCKYRYGRAHCRNRRHHEHEGLCRALRTGALLPVRTPILSESTPS